MGEKVDKGVCLTILVLLAVLIGIGLFRFFNDKGYLGMAKPSMVMAQEVNSMAGIRI